MALSDELARRMAKLRPAVRRVSITGTNGKTSTTAMIEAIITASGEPTACIDSLGCRVNGKSLTDDPILENIVKTIEEAVRSDVRTMAFEVSAGGLSKRIACYWPPHVAVFTNLMAYKITHHGSFEELRRVKSQLFLHLPPGGTAVLNAADPASAYIDDVVSTDVVRAAFTGGKVAAECSSLPVVLAAESIDVSKQGTLVNLRQTELGRNLGGSLQLRVIGEMYAQNALAAAVAADALGYSANAIRSGLEGFVGVPGRFTVVADEPTVIVDYAYTPGALSRSLFSARALSQGSARLFCVFGCGGSPSDRGLRTQMGEVARELADVVVLTNDNPRYDDPITIADEVERGASKTVGGRWIRELDRAKAIELAIAMAAPDDVVLIAGRGNEAYQQIADQLIPLSDQAIARAACERARL
jgi:UDP-N-acetylmuramoyl-L-alanyl-D-glutamate--2,6-diaminopimelate ligase